MPTESFFSNASLAYLASAGAGKDGKTYSIKPTDGTGDFTFSRGSNLAATRVGADGLIEKGRENLLTYSNQFDTTWGATNLLRTANTIANPLDGLVNSYTLSLNSGTSQKYISKNISQIGIYTQSVYLKAGTHQFVQLLIGDDTAAYANFDLVNGLKFFSGSGCIDANIEPIGADGWYRCSMKYKSTKGISLYVWAVDSLASARGSSTSSSGDLYVFGFQLEVGLTSTEYIESGASTGKAGLLEDEPRFDYSGGATCPSLLLEPSRTNLITQSEYFGDSSWFKGNVVVTPNSVVSPEGVQNGTKVDFLAIANANIQRSPATPTTIGVDYTISFYARADAPVNNVKISSVGGDTDLTITTSWQRFTRKITATATSTGTTLVTRDSVATTIYLYGFQVEAGSYPTSYIPNHSGTGSVTRGEDSLTPLNITSLVTGTPFTWFLDLNEWRGSDTNLGDLYLSNASGAQIQLRVRTDGYRFLYISINGGTSYPIGPSKTARKFCIKYDGSNFKLFRDGVLEDTTASVGDTGWSGLSQSGGGSTLPLDQILIFNEALSDADCITLTT